MRFRILAVLASCTVVLTACGAFTSPSSPATKATGPADFALVAYQGVDVLGGKQSHLARVIDLGPFVRLGSHQDAIKLYTQLGIQDALAYAVDSAPLQLCRVQGMPTTVFLSSSGRVDQETGVVTEDQLRTIIQQKVLAG